MTKNEYVSQEELTNELLYRILLTLQRIEKNTCEYEHESNLAQKYKEEILKEIKQV